MADPVVHFEILSKNPEQLHAFYRDVFGWAVNVIPEMNYATIDTQAGKGINGGIGPSQGGPNMVEFYVMVADIAGTLAKAESMGATTMMPPTEVMPDLRLAMFADPEGNPVGIINASQSPPENPGPSQGSGRPVGWFEIGGNDAAALRRFYAELFGWEIHADDPMGYGEVHAEEGNGIGGGITPSREGPYVTWYVEVDDMQGTIDRLASLGGKALMEPMDMSNVQISQFADPEGNRIGLYKNL